MSKLKQRWGITSNFQMAVIFVVFAINGTLSAEISKLLMGLLGISKATTPTYLYYPLLLVLVLPLYPFLLMAVGYLFGQSAFFFPFARKMLRSIGLGFVFGTKKTP
ncbi:diacylglyceryl transferase [Flavobacterium magnum]|uniref:Diacylglyceryl transferase n=1 Tax=Flavobacterium magnum TaxID=2162713 RepID=A0A2S0RGV9_9FLAO|nr:DUF6787 family protein [Flavobacterium magnum]AWA30468.1 diacylglyceryl transferase [Flavobacterium magnum]